MIEEEQERMIEEICTVTDQNKSAVMRKAIRSLYARMKDRIDADLVVQARRQKEMRSNDLQKLERPQEILIPGSSQKNEDEDIYKPRDQRTTVRQTAEIKETVRRLREKDRKGT